MAANQNIMLLYFCRSLFSYYVDGERNRAMSKYIELNSARVEYTLVAQPHNMHSRAKLAALHNTDDYVCFGGALGTSKVLYFHYFHRLI